MLHLPFVEDEQMRRRPHTSSDFVGKIANARGSIAQQLQTLPNHVGRGSLSSLHEFSCVKYKQLARSTKQSIEQALQNDISRAATLAIV
eukprot:6149063-Amphidinium_carterae.1